MLQDDCRSVRVVLCLALLGVSGLGARSLAAHDSQTPSGTVPTGFRLSTLVGLGKPFLGGSSAAYWEPLGTFGAGGGLDAGFGYDFRRVGTSLRVDEFRTHIGMRAGKAYSIALVLHWKATERPVLGAWQPLLTAGFVLEGIAVPNVKAEEVRDELTSGTRDTFLIRRAGLEGYGLRLGLAGEHRVGDHTAIILGASGDMVSFRTATMDGFGTSLRHPGWSFVPRLVAGIRYWPFTQ